MDQPGGPIFKVLAGSELLRFTGRVAEELNMSGLGKRLLF